tara:strand:- start:18686 stop:20881 length:2196 start_codon:yes stop_codon:yes gene_type:complete
MAITIVSSNLNIWGNAGNYETDPSTWGHVLISGDFLRSSTRAALGLYSQKYLAPADEAAPNHDFARGKAPVTVGKKYIVSAWLNIDDTYPIAVSDATIFSIKFDSFYSGAASVTTVTETTKTQTDASDTWVKVSIQVEVTAGTNLYPYLGFNVTAGDPINDDGILYVDQFEIFEYTDDVATCSILLSSGSTVVTDETVADEDDGSITVSATSDDDIEYRINGGAWQSSNLFAGLAPGSYLIEVREENNTDCTASASFSVQAADAPFTIAVAITNETVLGSADGIVTVTPSGGTGPYQYSKDGGSTYQSGNSFTALAAANYSIVVKDDTDALAYTNATVAAGSSAIAGLVFSQNPIPFAVNQTANSSEENYRIYAEVLVEDVPGSGTFNKKLSMALEPESTGTATFYLQQAFAGLFAPVAPMKNSAVIKEVTGRSLLYKVGRGDLYGEYTTAQGYTLSSIYKVLLGGISKKQYPTLNYLASYLATNKKFLSWKPTERYIDATQEEYLTFFNYSTAITQIKLFAKAWYTDGTIGDDFDTGLALACTYAKHYEIPAGAAFNNVALEVPEKTLIKYQLWLQNTAEEEVTERITFNIAPFRKATTRYFMCRNSLGAFEVLRLTGEAIETADFEKETMQRFLGHSYTGAELESFNGSYQTSWKMSTGYYEGPQGYAYIKSLYDLMLSPQVYEITNGLRLPRLILPGSVQVKVDKDSRYFLRFDCVDPYIEKNYTPDL